MRLKKELLLNRLKEQREYQNMELVKWIIIYSI
jgi:hypothetical protein